jgi:hypothetical protein
MVTARRLESRQIGNLSEKTAQRMLDLAKSKKLPQLMLMHSNNLGVVSLAVSRLLLTALKDGKKSERILLESMKISDWKKRHIVVQGLVKLRRVTNSRIILLALENILIKSEREKTSRLLDADERFAAHEVCSLVEKELISLARAGNKQEQKFFEQRGIRWRWQVG